jgi:hypothetical protein
MALDALRSAVKHSLGDTDPDGTWVPDAHAFDAADFACQQRQPELMLDITRIWALPRGVYDYHNDNLDVFQAAAELQLGRFDEAAADLERVLQKGNTGSLWADHVDQLHHGEEQELHVRRGNDAVWLDVAPTPRLILARSAPRQRSRPSSLAAGAAPGRGVAAQRSALPAQFDRPAGSIAKPQRTPKMESVPSRQSAGIFHLCLRIQHSSVKVCFFHRRRLIIAAGFSG